MLKECFYVWLTISCIFKNARKSHFELLQTLWCVDFSFLACQIFNGNVSIHQGSRFLGLFEVETSLAFIIIQCSSITNFYFQHPLLCVKLNETCLTWQHQKLSKNCGNELSFPVHSINVTCHQRVLQLLTPHFDASCYEIILVVYFLQN